MVCRAVALDTGSRQMPLEATGTGGSSDLSDCRTSDVRFGTVMVISSLMEVSAGHMPAGRDFGED